MKTSSLVLAATAITPSLAAIGYPPLLGPRQLTAQECAGQGGQACGEGCIPADWTCCPDETGGCSPDNYCVLGANGEYGCCAKGETCTGNGGATTSTQTQTDEVTSSVTETVTTGEAVTTGEVVTTTSEASVTSTVVETESTDSQTETVTSTETTAATSTSSESSVMTTATYTVPPVSPTLSTPSTYSTPANTVTVDTTTPSTSLTSVETAASSAPATSLPIAPWPQPLPNGTTTGAPYTTPGGGPNVTMVTSALPGSPSIPVVTAGAATAGLMGHGAAGVMAAVAALLI